jgi:hypothetical protein
MRTSTIQAALVTATLAMLGSTGCVIHTHDNPPPSALPGNVNLVWRFTDGNNCSSLSAFISHIQVTIPGQALQNGGAFPCQLAGTQGVQLQDFDPGVYSFTVQALDSRNYPIYTASGSFTVNGDITVDVPLTPTTQPLAPGNVDLLWSFGDGLTCNQLAGQVSEIVVTIPGETLAGNGVYSCESSGTQGIELQDFAGGDYNYTIDAMDSTGTVSLYHAEGTFEVNGDISVPVTLTRTSNNNGDATLQLRWDFLDATNARHNCSAAGIDNVQVTIGSYAPQVVPCSANGVDGADFSNLPVGVYSIELDGLQGSGNNATEVYSITQSVVVSAGTDLVTMDLQPQVALTWDLSYTFSGGASCAAAGVSQLSLSVKDDQGDELSGATQNYPCQDSPNNVFEWTNFYAGNVTIRLIGYDSGGTPLRGILATSNLPAGAADETPVILQLCGTTGSGC